MIYFYIKLLLIIIVFYLLILWYRNNLLLKKIISKNKDVQIEVIKNFTILAPLLKKHDIKYFLMAGTLLGFKRHNKHFIPYDDDIDIGIVDELNLKKKINKVNKDLKQYGLKIDEIFYGYVLWSQNKYRIDLFLYQKEIGNNKYFFNNFISKTMYPNEYFYEDEIFPLKSDYFENIEVFIPNQYDDYIFRTYGKDCMKTFKLTHSHVTNYVDLLILVLTCKTPLKPSLIDKYISKDKNK